MFGARALAACFEIVTCAICVLIFLKTVLQFAKCDWKLAGLAPGAGFWTPQILFFGVLDFESPSPSLVYFLVSHHRADPLGGKES